MLLESTANSFYHGFHLAIDNSKSLSRVADKAAEEGRFGIASSLKILAGEEAIKALALLIMFFENEQDISKIKILFRKHTAKHQLLAEVSPLVDALIEIKNTEFGILDYLFESLEKFPNASKEEIKKIENSFSQVLGYTKQKKNTKQKEEESLKWWRRADGIKMRGLYVDQVNNNWHTPESITEEAYLEATKHCDLLTKNADALLEIFRDFRKK